MRLQKISFDTKIAHYSPPPTHKEKATPCPSSAAFETAYGLLLRIFLVLHFVLKSLHFFFPFTVKPWIACGIATNLPHMSHTWQRTSRSANFLRGKSQPITKIKSNKTYIIYTYIRSIRSSALKCPTIQKQQWWARRNITILPARHLWLSKISRSILAFSASVCSSTRFWRVKDSWEVTHLF